MPYTPPAEAKKYWIDQSGKMTVVRYGLHHWEQPPPRLLPIPDYDPADETGREEEILSRIANEAGYYRATLLNDRLYVKSCSLYPLSRKATKELEDLAIEKGWHRGVMIEEL